MLIAALLVGMLGAAEPRVPTEVPLVLPPATDGLEPLLQSVRAGAWWGQRALCELPPSVPRLRVVDSYESKLAVEDEWQVQWGDVALSDAQLARLSKDPLLIALTQEELESRSTWVYVGLGISAVGAAVASAGWILYGQDQIDQGITIPMAIGGLLAGVAGVILLTHSIQAPLEPHLAPTPKHRFSREQAEAVVHTVNSDLYGTLCREPTR